MGQPVFCTDPLPEISKHRLLYSGNVLFAMNYLFSYSKLNMNVVSFLILIGLDLGLCMHSVLFINALYFLTMKSVTNFDYHCLAAAGFLCGILASGMIPEIKDKIDSFSGVENRIFNLMDYAISIVTGYVISFSFFIINASVTQIYGGFRNLIIDKDIVFVKCSIIFFGLLHGMFYSAVIDGKVFGSGALRSKAGKAVFLIFFLIFCFYIAPMILKLISPCMKFICKQIIAATSTDFLE